MRVSTYRVYYTHKNCDGIEEYDDIYLSACNAQECADFVREKLDAVEVLEIARVLGNWK